MLLREHERMIVGALCIRVGRDSAYAIAPWLVHAEAERLYAPPNFSPAHVATVIRCTQVSTPSPIIV